MTNNDTKTLSGTRFGDVHYGKEDVVRFPEGLIGFWQATDFILVTTQEGSPFRFLQSVQEPELAFLLADPNHFVPEYRAVLSEVDSSELRIDQSTPHLVFATATIPKGSPQDMTLNLAAPIVINIESQIGGQVLLDNPSYSIRHQVFEKPAAKKSGKKKAA